MITPPLVSFVDFRVELNLGVTFNGQAQQQAQYMQTTVPVAITFRQCMDCGALLSQSFEWQHQQFHQSLVRLKRNE